MIPAKSSAASQLWRARRRVRSWSALFCRKEGAQVAQHLAVHDVAQADALSLEHRQKLLHACVTAAPDNQVHCVRREPHDLLVTGALDAGDDLVDALSGR
jgi:hypothetical protein